VTTSRLVAEEAAAALPGHWDRMTPERVQFSRTVLNGPHGGIILAPSMAEAYRFVNDYAPEHLEILSAEPFVHLGQITNAAEVLMGPHTPLTLGELCARAQLRAAYRRLGPHLRATLGHGLHEAVLGRIRDLGGISRNGPACTQTGRI
jgi:hypothetical protein